MGWQEDIVQALRNLGGEAELNDIYKEVKSIRGPHRQNNATDQTIMGALERASSSSAVWKAGNPDIFERVRPGRWGLRDVNASPETKKEIPDGISRDDILGAIKDLDGHIQHNFHESTGYDVWHGSGRYPPKAVIGLAARRVRGQPLSSKEFRVARELLVSKFYAVSAFPLHPKPVQKIVLSCQLGLQPISGLNSQRVNISTAAQGGNSDFVFGARP